MMSHEWGLITDAKAIEIFGHLNRINTDWDYLECKVCFSVKATPHCYYSYDYLTPYYYYLSDYGFVKDIKTCEEAIMDSALE